MKCLNKKLYSVIIACLLMLCCTIVAMATEVTEDPDIIDSSKVEGIISSDIDSDVSSKVSSTSNFENTNEESSSNSTTDNTDDSSSNDSTEIQSSSDSKVETESSSSKITSSSITNSKLTASTESKDESSSVTTTSNKSSNNIGGIVNDEPDTSGWGNNQEMSSEISSDENEDSTQKRKEKNITDYSSLFWVLIWIPILLILASVGALVYVNRKAFLQEDNSRFDDAIEPVTNKNKLSAEEKAKRKNNHKNRTNVYRPRD